MLNYPWLQNFQKIALENFIKTLGKAKQKIPSPSSRFSKSKTEGFENTLSEVNGVTSDSPILDNKVAFSHLHDIHCQGQQPFKLNIFVCSQWIHTVIDHTDIVANTLKFSRITGGKWDHSKVSNNRLDLSSLESLDISHSALLQVSVEKSRFIQTYFKESRLENVGFFKCHVAKVTMEHTELSGIYFDNCQIDGCSFKHVHVHCPEYIKLSNLKLSGKTFENIQNLEDFLQALGVKNPAEESSTPTDGQSSGRRYNSPRGQDRTRGSGGRRPHTPSRDRNGGNRSDRGQAQVQQPIMEDAPRESTGNTGNTVSSSDGELSGRSNHRRRSTPPRRFPRQGRESST